MDLSFLVKNKIVINIFRIIVIWTIVAVARNFVEEKVENILTILGFIFTILIILGLASYWFWKKYKWSKKSFSFFSIYKYFATIVNT